MDVSDLTFLGGLLLGFTSSLHCAGMCGGIAASMMFAFDRSASGTDRERILLTTQAGRILAYVSAGAFLGAIGSQFYGAFNHAGAHEVMRWAAAAALGWIGLSMTGFAPPLSALDRIGGPIIRLIATPSRLAIAGGTGGPLVAGFAWGFLPCGMVFGALFYAMLTGSGSGGAMVMTGFGIGTLPSVLGTAFGISALRKLGQRPQIRIAAGAAMMMVAAASVLIPAAAWEGLCIT